MIDLKKYLYEKTKQIIEKWDEDGIYAISFFVYANEAFEYKQYSNVCEFAISYNTEKFCENASPHSEERWNYAFWQMNTSHIIDPNAENDEGIKVLFEWYGENGVKNIGIEDFDNAYDENMMYIGKGAGGLSELLTVVSDVARQLQEEGFIAQKFGKIPIVIHDLEYSWYTIDATKNANPNGEAEVFFEALEKGFE